MSRYPDWVNQYKTKGTSVKKCGENYYLYRTTSRRVPGKRNPQPVSQYIGVIRPEGVDKAKRMAIPYEDVRVWEYGFSRAVMEMLPSGWIEWTKEDARTIAASIVMKESPFSYLRLEYGEPDEALASRRASLEEKLGFPLSRLDILKGIFLVEGGGRRMISVIDDRQQELLDALGVDICLEPG